MDPIQPVERPRIRPAYVPGQASAQPYQHPLKRSAAATPAKPQRPTCQPPRPPGPPSEPVVEWRAPKLAPPPPPTVAVSVNPAPNVTKVKRDLRDPKQQGMEAYDVGHGLKQNPYPNGAPGHSEWRRGWAIASSRDRKGRPANAPTQDLRPVPTATPAFQFGWQAGKRGEPLSRNPYKDTARYEQWTKGWRSGVAGDPTPVPPAPGGPKPKRPPEAPRSQAQAEVAAGTRELRTIKAALKQANVSDAYLGALAFRIQSALATNCPPKFRVKGESIDAATFTGHPGSKHEFYASVTLLLAPAFTAEMKGRFLFRGNGETLWDADIQPAFKPLFAKFPGTAVPPTEEAPK